MPDIQVPYYPVVMMCSDPEAIRAPLPDGYSFEFFKPGMENAWCQIQRSVKAFSDVEAARKQFDREFAPHPRLLARRMVFICDSCGRAVGTGTLWRDHNLERLHWIAVVPGMHGQGVGKALVAKLMDIYRMEGCKKGIYLTSQTISYPAVNIYRQFGFVPDIGMNVLPEPQSEEVFRKAWGIINEKLLDHERSRGRVCDDNGLFIPPSAILLERAEMFIKSSMCKVFAMSAPEQSGNVPHYHDYSQIWYVTRGRCIHEVEGQCYEMTVGDAFFMPPKMIHRTCLKDGGSIICCEFDMESLLQHTIAPYDQIQEITQNLSFTMLFQQELFHQEPKFTFSRDAQQRIEQLMRSTLDEYNRGDEFFEDFLQLQILQILLTFAREYNRSAVYEESEQLYVKYRAMVEAAIRYIDEHYGEPLNLDGMCRISMVSKTYFCYIFKLLTHKTFVEYLMAKRIERSMTLLRETDMTIIEIGHSVGFQDSTHFSRTFKKLRGISPREYRNGAKRQAEDAG